MKSDTHQQLIHRFGAITVTVDPEAFLITVEEGENRLMQFPLSAGIDTLDGRDVDGPVALVSVDNLGNTGWEARFSCASTYWRRKEYLLRCTEGVCSYQVSVTPTVEDRRNVTTCDATDPRRIASCRYFVQESQDNQAATIGVERLYAPRFDWSVGAVFKSPRDDESLSCQQWLSPPPFYYGLGSQNRWFGIGLAVKPGEYNFQSFDYNGSGGSAHFELQYEGHLRPDKATTLPELLIFLEPEETELAGVERYVAELRKRHLVAVPDVEIPDWWREPIFCGWGQQRLDYRRDHDGGENDCWINAGDYATESFYRHHLETLEEHGIEPGTVIIDCFWARRPGFAEPHPLKWTDMRGFIDEQHEKGRRVLLWLTPIIYEGYPIEACMTLDGRPVATDPTSPIFLDIFGTEVEKMISSSPGCLDADGFKIDFTQSIPAEDGRFRPNLNSRWAIITEDQGRSFPFLNERSELIQLTESLWGVELIKRYLQAIRGPMKRAKPGSLLIAQTANPYFADDVDMLRLNDMDGTSPDVLGIMNHRAAISRLCNPGWLIDTDNDLMINKAMWREYIRLQPQLGVPDTYYADGIAQSGEEFSEADYDLLREIWAEYRKGLTHSPTVRKSCLGGR